MNNVKRYVKTGFCAIQFLNNATWRHINGEKMKLASFMT